MTKATPKKPKKSGTVLVLRTCDAKLRSHGGFTWPAKGPVSCSDWNPAPVCGGGLHGLLWGQGDGGLLNWDDSARWLVVEVAAADVVEIDKQKCKFPRGVVVFCGAAEEAVKLIASEAPAGTVIVGGTATAGDEGTATAGDGGTATAGDGGTATAGDGGAICVRWWDEKTSRYRTAVGYIGEDGLIAGVGYCWRDGKFEKVKP